MMNAESDAGMYKWNYATQGAIYEGVSIYFNQVKPKANEYDSDNAEFFGYGDDISDEENRSADLIAELDSSVLEANGWVSGGQARDNWETYKAQMLPKLRNISPITNNVAYILEQINWHTAVRLLMEEFGVRPQKSTESKATEELTQCPTCDGLGTTWTDTAYDEGYSDLCPTCSGRGMISTTSRIRESKANAKEVKGKPSDFNLNNRFHMIQHEAGDQCPNCGSTDTGKGREVYEAGTQGWCRTCKYWWQMTGEVSKATELEDGMYKRLKPHWNILSEKCNYCGWQPLWMTAGPDDPSFHTYYEQQEDEIMTHLKQEHGITVSKANELDVGVYRTFNKCDGCDKVMGDININMNDPDAVAEQEKKERLCRKCQKERSLSDSVIEKELRDAGIMESIANEVDNSMDLGLLSGGIPEVDVSNNEQCEICGQLIDQNLMDYHVEQEHGLHVPSQYTQGTISQSMGDPNYDHLEDWRTAYGENKKIANEDYTVQVVDEWDRVVDEIGDLDKEGAIQVEHDFINGEYVEKIADGVLHIIKIDEETGQREGKNEWYESKATEETDSEPDNISESEGKDEPEYYDESNLPEDWEDEKEKSKEKKSKAEEALNKGASAEEIYSLVDTKSSEDDRTQSEDDYLTNLYNKTTANKSAGFSDLR